MFVSAVSVRGADSTKPNDVAIGNSIGDLTPATFRVEFDEPLKIKNADIELVACKISKKNEIVINAGNNQLCVRMGDSSVAEQYSAKIPVGNYLPAVLADAISQALNYVMPVNIYKGFSCTIVANKIKITYTISSAPSSVPFQDQLKEEVKVIQDGVSYPIRTDDGNYVKFECSASQQAQIRGPLRIPTEDWEFCGSLDLGTRDPDRLQRNGIDQFGIWEDKKGVFTSILRPVSSVVKSTFDAGYGGFAGTSLKPTYMTFEFEENQDEDGNPVSGLYEYGGMFNSNTLKDNVPREYNSKYHKQINGVLNRTFAHNDARGAPYNLQSSFHFPYCNNPKVNGSAQNSRKIYYDKTWSGCIDMRKQAGRPPANQPGPVPDTYSFQIDEISAEKKAICLAKRRGFKTDKVKIRPSILPLILGLPQQQVANGPVIDTFCSIQLPLVVAAVNIRYIVGTTGQLNFTGYGPQWLIDNEQGLQIGGGPNGIDLYKLPYYKILTIDANGSPVKVCLTDGGEHTIVFDGTNPTTTQNTSLYLNDPNTWEEIIVSGDAEDTIMEEQIFRIEPNALDIGILETLKVKKQYRFPSFNMGLQRDDLFQLQNNNFPPAPYGDDPNKLLISKDIQIDLYSKLENNDGSVTPNEGQIEVSINQLQPQQPNDDSLSIYADIESKKLLFNASSNTWNAKNGDGVAMVNWGAGSFTGVNNADAAIKISIKQTDTYNQSIEIGYTNLYVDTTTIFNNGVGPGATELVRTGITRGGGGKKMEVTQKTRFFPYHPVFSQIPCSISEKTINYYQCIGSEYPLRNCYYPITGKSNFQNNYEANLAFMAKGDFNAPQNIFPPTNAPPGGGGPPGNKPVIMIKSQKLEPSQISPGPSPPPAGSVDLCVIEDFTPEEGGSLYNAGLHSIMYSVWGGGAFVDFAQDAVPIKQPFMPSFAVEIQNLPLSGYVGKGFDEGKSQDRRGLGSRLPIVGIVPATEFPESNDIIINYHYKTPYYQPVQVRLATPTFLYSLDINLRNLVSGRLLQDLIHSSEVILRIYPLPD